MSALQFFPLPSPSGTVAFLRWQARQPDGEPAGYIEQRHRTFHVVMLPTDGPVEPSYPVYTATLRTARHRLCRMWARHFGQPS